MNIVLFVSVIPTLELDRVCVSLSANLKMNVLTFEEACQHVVCGEQTTSQKIATGFCVLDIAQFRDMVKAQILPSGYQVVFIVSSPEQMMCGDDVTSTLETSEFIESLNQLVRFFLHHNQQTLIVDYPSVCRNPHSLVNAIREKQQSEVLLTDQFIDFPPIKTLAVQELNTLLCIVQNPVITEMYEELYSCVAVSDELCELDPVNRILLLKERLVQETVAQKDAFEAQQEHLNLLESSKEKLFADKRALEEHVSELTSSISRLEQKNDEIAQIKHGLDNKVVGLQVDNELSLMQIHHLQEELEYYYYAYVDSQNETSFLSDDSNALLLLNKVRATQKKQRVA